jgi:hypothetical protein
MDSNKQERTMEAFKTWEEMTVLEQYACQYWDMYKDAYGHRPRWIDTTAWTLEIFEAEFASLATAIEQAEIERKADQAHAIAKFEDTVNAALRSSSSTSTSSAAAAASSGVASSPSPKSTSASSSSSSTSSPSTSLVRIPKFISDMKTKPQRFQWFKKTNPMKFLVTEFEEFDENWREVWISKLKSDIAAVTHS